MSTEAQLDWPKLHYFLRSLQRSKHVHLFPITAVIWRNYNSNSAGGFLNTWFQCLIVTVLKKLQESKEWGIQEVYLCTDTFNWSTNVSSHIRHKNCEVIQFRIWVKARISLFLYPVVSPQWTSWKNMPSLPFFSRFALIWIC